MAGVIMHQLDHIRIRIIMVGDQAKKLTTAPRKGMLMANKVVVLAIFKVGNLQG